MLGGFVVAIFLRSLLWVVFGVLFFLRVVFLVSWWVRFFFFFLALFLLGFFVFVFICFFFVFLFLFFF